MICKICNDSMRLVFQQRLLKKYEVSYFFCDSCGFMQTEDPYWLEEAYSSPIASADTGIMQRNIHLSNISAFFLWRLFGGHGKFLDVAGGYGIFTRIMRDIGFDYYWADAYSPNLVARGFEAVPSDGPFLAVSAFEVLEHLTDPLGFLEDLINSSGAKTILASTELFSGQPPDPNDWWYYTFNTGQHISFFQRSTLEHISRRLGLRLYSVGSFHMWTSQRISSIEFRLILRPKVAALSACLPRLRLRSRLLDDHQRLVQ